MNLHYNRTTTTVGGSGGSLRRENLEGREHLVAPVRAMQAMRLDGGYVPAAHVEASVPAWNGTAVTLNHPRTPRGELTSANDPALVEKVWLGRYFNAAYDPDAEALDGEVWIDTARAEEMGGGAGEVVEMLENGSEVSVSTSYFADRLPPGEYDGEHREVVAGNIRPDHLAMLPNKDGRCSIEDGCMAGEDAHAVAANACGCPPEPSDEFPALWVGANDGRAQEASGDAEDGDKLPALSVADAARRTENGRGCACGHTGAENADAEESADGWRLSVGDY